MGFWIFMFVMDLLMPLTMFGCGKYFLKHTPKEINYIFGYRTSMSMKNKETWEFAHHYCGKILLGITVVVMLAVIGKEENTIGTVSGILCFVQLILIIGSIIPTEIALRRTFDKNGKKR